MLKSDQSKSDKETYLLTQPKEVLIGRIFCLESNLEMLKNDYIHAGRILDWIRRESNWERFKKHQAAKNKQLRPYHEGAVWAFEKVTQRIREELNGAVSLRRDARTSRTERRDSRRLPQIPDEPGERT